MKTFILTIISIIICVVAIVYLTNVLKVDLKMYRAESSCVSKYVIDGAECKKKKSTPRVM